MSIKHIQVRVSPDLNSRFKLALWAANQNGAAITQQSVVESLIAHWADAVLEREGIHVDEV